MLWMAETVSASILAGSRGNPPHWYSLAGKVAGIEAQAAFQTICWAGLAEIRGSMGCPLKTLLKYAKLGMGNHPFRLWFLVRCLTGE